MTSTEHEFGGPWTEVKLDAIAEYLWFFTNALKAKPSPSRAFHLWYIDAFAGTGRRTTTKIVGGIFEGGPIDVQKVELDGSARRALAIEPFFKRLVFMEQHAGRFAALQKLENEFPNRGISVRSGDGNEELRKIFESPPWSNQVRGRGLQRAVVFLDPYDMSVRWSTLKLLSNTGAVDVWYLFPLNAVVRQLARKYTAVDQSKQAALDEIFGTPDWRKDLYEELRHSTVFGDEEITVQRTASQRQIEIYFKERLETLFPYVSSPLPLLTPRGSQLFSLFCVSANDSIKARLLVDSGVSHVLAKYG